MIKTANGGLIERMKPLFVRKLTSEESAHLQQQLQSPSAFTVRRCQILLKSNQGQKAQEIAAALLCSDQTVRQAIRAFEREGLSCLVEKSHARHGEQAMIDEAGAQRLRELIQLSPRTVGYETSVWTRPLLAEQLYKEGHLERPVTAQVITTTLKRLGISWRRAKQWIRSPDRHYEHRKKDETS